MPKTQIRSEQIANQQIKRVNLNTTTAGQAIIAKILAGTGISIGSTGVDVGTGDVTISVNSTVTTNSDTQTLSNKSLVDNSTFFIDNADASKKIKLELSSITTNTIRTITVPDADFTIAPLASPNFTGIPTAPTASVAINSNQIATTAYVVNQIAASTTLPVWGSITGTLSNQTDLQSELNLKANLASPTFTGIPLAPTAASNTNTTQLATTAFVQTAISNLINAAPTQLDTLNELAAALGNDANFATTITNQLATKQPVGNYITALTGDVTATGPNSVTATVTRIQGRNIASAAPTDQQALRWNNALSQWEPQTIIGMGIGNQITGASAGSVLFAGAGGVLAQDNGNFFWDDANNRLGIGTTTPAAPLSVFSSTVIGTQLLAHFQATGVSGNAQLGLQTQGGTGLFALDASGNLIFRTEQAGLYFDAKGAANINFRTTNSLVNRLFLANGGNVGINTTSPSAQLHAVASASGVIGAIVQGAVSQSANLQEWRNSAGVALSVVNASGFLGIGTSSPVAGISLERNGSSAVISVRDTYDSLSREYRFGSLSAGSPLGGQGDFVIAEYNGGSLIATRLSVQKTTGYIGIGTTSPNAMLHLNAPAAASTREYLIKTNLNDVGSDAFYLYNGTVIDSRFIPTLAGIHNSGNDRSSLMMVGFVSAANDASDSCETGLIDNMLVRSGNSANPANGTLSTVQSRKLWTVRTFDGTNSSFKLLLAANGNFGIGTVSPASLLSVGANSEFQVRSNGSVKPASMTDAAAANDSIYYSTDQGKLCYKDSSGVSNPLY